MSNPAYKGKHQNLPGCMSLEERRDKMKAKADTQFQAGIAAFIIWSFMPENDGSCAFETITYGDPIMTLLQE